MKLSRSAIEQFIRCPRCFYLQRGQGVRPPAMVPLTLAVAVDALLKNEFDRVRQSGSSHPLWEREGLRVRAFRHADMEIWRSNFRGIRIRHLASGAEIHGAIDDVWQNLDTGELHIVDYKSTSKKGEPSLNGGFGDGYRRQMEIYQWLFRQAGFAVSRIGYFLYVNALKDGGFYETGLSAAMRFNTRLIPHEGDDSWVEGTIDAAVACLGAAEPSASGADCDNCRYFSERLESEAGWPEGSGQAVTDGRIKDSRL